MLKANVNQKFCYWKYSNFSPHPHSSNFYPQNSRSIFGSILCPLSTSSPESPFTPTDSISPPSSQPHLPPITSSPSTSSPQTQLSPPQQARPQLYLHHKMHQHLPQTFLKVLDHLAVYANQLQSSTRRSRIRRENASSTPCLQFQPYFTPICIIKYLVYLC